jgi:predicted metal-dependent peptidase
MPNSGAAKAAETGLLTHRGTRAVQRLVEYAPATGGLALWAHHHDLAEDEARRAPVETDGHALRYRPAFERLPLEQQAGWVAHEVLHLALRHPQRYTALQRLTGDVDLALFNRCADAVVNSALAHLGWLALPAGALQLETLLASALSIHTSAEAALLEWDVERLYRAIDDRPPPLAGRAREDGPRASRVRALGGPGQGDLAPAEGEASAPELEAEHAREWRERLLRAHANDGEFSMLRTLLADLPKSSVPWPQVLRTQLARGLSKQRGLSWSRPARSYIAHQGRMGTHRMPFEPGSGATLPTPRLALMVDVSGSVDRGLMDRFARELQAIVRRAESALVMVVGDDRVRLVHRFAPGKATLPELRFEGGGGTDFTPLLEEADRHRPDLGVFLTDLEGPANFRPRWPVIWAVPSTQAAHEAPFGRRLLID